MRERTIYFDYNATTPLDPAVREAMLPFLGDICGNPSSVHHVGRRARSFLDDARDRTAKVLGCKPSEVVFTSGGTESNNLAIFGAARLLKPKGRHLITSAVEHHAVLHCFQYLAKKEGFEVTCLPVDREGLVSPDDLKRPCVPTRFWSPSWRRTTKSAPSSRSRNWAPSAASAACCFTRTPCNGSARSRFRTVHQFNADLVSICAHKFHGPKGAGALFIRSPLQPDPILFGGSHENERRAGTENVAGIIGLVEALERFVPRPVFDREKLAPLADRLHRLVERLGRCSIRRFARTAARQYGFLCRGRLGQHRPAGGLGSGGHLRFERFGLFGGVAGAFACHCRPGRGRTTGEFAGALFPGPRFDGGGNFLCRSRSFPALSNGHNVTNSR